MQRYVKVWNPQIFFRKTVWNPRIFFRKTVWNPQILFHSTDFIKAIASGHLACFRITDGLHRLLIQILSSLWVIKTVVCSHFRQQKYDYFPYTAIKQKKFPPRFFSAGILVRHGCSLIPSSSCAGGRLRQGQPTQRCRCPRGRPGRR